MRSRKPAPKRSQNEVRGKLNTSGTKGGWLPVGAEAGAVVEASPGSAAAVVLDELLSSVDAVAAEGAVAANSMAGLWPEAVAACKPGPGLGGASRRSPPKAAVTAHPNPHALT